MLLGKILLVNLKNNFLIHFVLAIAVAVLTPVVFTISSLDSRTAAQPLEMLLVFIGMIMLTPIFQPEHNEEIRDVIRSKKTSYLLVCVIRVLYSVFAIFLITALFVLLMKYNECDVTWRHIIGGGASALFLGTVGFAVSGLSGSVSAGYMACFVYYAANIGLKDKLGRCYLFSMYVKDNFNDKYWLIACSAALFAITFLWLKLFRYKSVMCNK